MKKNLVQGVRGIKILKKIKLFSFLIPLNNFPCREIFKEIFIECEGESVILRAEHQAKVDVCGNLQAVLTQFIHVDWIC